MNLDQFSSETSGFIEKPDYKLYSLRAISITTFFGGPLAAGILARQNFLNLRKENHAKIAIAVGFIATLLIFGIIFLIPENVMNSVPSYLIPGIYTPIIYYIIEKYQGKELKDHKSRQGNFYSAWKAAGIGSISMVVILIAGIGYYRTVEGNFDTDQFNSGMATFGMNEEKAMELYNMVEHKNGREIYNFIQAVGIPLWEKNIEILNGLEQMDGLSEKFHRQNKILIEYCQLRIEVYGLIKKMIEDNTDAYADEVSMINEKIDAELKKLKSN